jgi:deoxyribodipyrimidine photo-lyase
MKLSKSLIWFRRDLRLDDNTALFEALQHEDALYAVFVFDQTILAGLPVDDARIGFIHHAVAELKSTLQAAGGDLVVLHGDPVSLIPQLARELNCSTVYVNRDYEPQARRRDAQVAEALAAQACQLVSCKDQVIFECSDILTGQGKPYTVFTPYMRAWRKAFRREQAAPYPASALAGRVQPCGQPSPMPTLAELGFSAPSITPAAKPGRDAGLALLSRFGRKLPHYKVLRDYPGEPGVSGLSAHLRFGTVSIREAVSLALSQENEGADCWLNELIWREFYQQLLWHFPHVAQQSFKVEYRTLDFPGKEAWFTAWCEGRTGYPIVDAAMQQLNQTGYMHNRLRMIVASFLVKDLLIDWRRGEAYFAAKLMDFDLAANNGGWQWAASTGCDAQPYFRIFNPVTQSEKFDPEGRFIRRYLPQLAALDNKSIHAPWLAKQLPLGFTLGQDYPEPIVDHAVQRERALALFGKQS